MAKRETHDIYSAEHKASRADQEPSSGPAHDNPWVESMRQMRRTTIAFRVVLLLFVFILAAVVIDQFVTLTRLRAAPPVPERTSDVALRSASLFDFEGIRFDMTFWVNVCYCEHCRRRFAEEAGGEILDANPKAVADLAAGKKQARGFLIGQVMKATKGKANPKVAGELIERLSSG